jgi:hypothetical protein
MRARQRSRTLYLWVHIRVRIWVGLVLSCTTKDDIEVIRVVYTRFLRAFNVCDNAVQFEIDLLLRIPGMSSQQEEIFNFSKGVSLGIER